MDGIDRFLASCNHLMYNVRQILPLILLSFAALYALISLRDAKGDLRFIFEARLLRRIAHRHIIWATVSAVLFFALVLLTETPLADWPFMALLFAGAVGGFLLIRTMFKDIRGDFQRRMIRGLSGNRFSLRHLLELTALVALAFAIIRIAQMPPIDWPFAFMFAGFCYGAYHLIRLAITDVTFRGSKRRYSNRCQRSQDAPDIRLLTPSSTANLGRTERLEMGEAGRISSSLARESKLQ